MLTMILATLFSVQIAGAPQSFDFQASQGTTYRVAVTSHCSCYRLSPSIVVPVVEVLDASGHRVAITLTEPKGVDRGHSQFDFENELTFTATSDGTYAIRVTPAAGEGYVGRMSEQVTQAGFGNGKSAVLTSYDSTRTPPIALSQKGRVTVTVGQATSPVRF